MALCWPLRVPYSNWCRASGDPLLDLGGVTASGEQEND